MTRGVEDLLSAPVRSTGKPVGANSLGLQARAEDPATPAHQASAPLFWSIIRDLQPGEEARLEQTPLGVRPIPLVRVREIHHQLARLLAQGIRPVEISAITGFSQSRISILQRDPSFKELVAFYQHRKDEVAADIASRLQGLTLDALAALHERLVDSPEAITTDELQRAVNAGLDRLGHGTKSTLEVNFIGPQTLARLKTAAQEGQVKIRQQSEEADDQAPKQTATHPQSPGPVIDVPESDIVSSPEPADPLRGTDGASTESRQAPPKGRTPGGAPI